MFQILIVSDSFNHFEKPIWEYLKRLWKDIKLIKIKPEKKWEIWVIIKKETEKLKEFIEKEKWFFVWLDFEWDEMSTEWFLDFTSKTVLRQGKITFVIGGSYWYDKAEINKILHRKVALSKMTLPHSAALLFLLEQIYRIKMIEKGSGYHH